MPLYMRIEAVGLVIDDVPEAVAVLADLSPTPDVVSVLAEPTFIDPTPPLVPVFEPTTPVP